MIMCRNATTMIQCFVFSSSHFSEPEWNKNDKCDFCQVLLLFWHKDSLGPITKQSNLKKPTFCLLLESQWTSHFSDQIRHTRFFMFHLLTFLITGKKAFDPFMSTYQVLITESFFFFFFGSFFFLHHSSVILCKGNKSFVFLENSSATEMFGWVIVVSWGNKHVHKHQKPSKLQQCCMYREWRGIASVAWSWNLLWLSLKLPVDFDVLHQQYIDCGHVIKWTKQQKMAKDQDNPA